jgi:HSP20 family protein
MAVFQGRAAVRGDGAWVPAVDIYETASDELVIRAELPDMKREAIAVTVEHGALTISGERTPPADVATDAFRRVERAYGKFSRRFMLPPSVDTSKVAAEYKDGMLSVRLPRREESKPRAVPVAS